MDVRRVAFDTMQTTLGVVSSTGSAADLNDLDSDLNEIFIKEVLSGKLSVDSRDESGRTALFYSDYNQIPKLIAMGANPFLKDKNGKLAHEYTRNPCSRKFLLKFQESFENSDRNKTIPITTQIKIFSKSFDFDAPDLILIAIIENSKTGLINEYGIRFSSNQNYESKIKFLSSWFNYVISETIEEHKIRGYLTPESKNASTSISEFKKSYRDIKSYDIERLYNGCYMFLASLNPFLMTPAWTNRIENINTRACDLRLSFSGEIVESGIERIMKMKTSDRVIKI